jgi:hypothetical protein
MNKPLAAPAARGFEPMPSDDGAKLLDQNL